LTSTVLRKRRLGGGNCSEDFRGSGKKRAIVCRAHLKVNPIGSKFFGDVWGSCGWMFRIITQKEWLPKSSKSKVPGLKRGTSTYQQDALNREDEAAGVGEKTNLARVTKSAESRTQ